jgi:hypothetical protein
MGIIRAGHPLAEALIGAAVDEELEIPAGGDKRIVTVVGIEKDVSKLQVQEPATNAPLGGIVSGAPEVVGDVPLLSDGLHIVNKAHTDEFRVNRNLPAAGGCLYCLVIFVSDDVEIKYAVVRHF